jgi:hypothetical protein
MFNKTDIKEHMEVLGSDGQHIGTVDYLEGSSDIKLTKSDPKSGGQPSPDSVGLGRPRRPARPSQPIEPGRSAVVEDRGLRPSQQT